MSSIQQPQNPYASFGTAVANADASERSTFLKKTYIHLAAAIYLLVALEYAIFATAGDAIDRFMETTFLSNRWYGLLVLIAFMVVSTVADRWARSDTSRGMQYLGLTVYVVAWALMLVPLLWIADTYSKPIDLGALGQISTIAGAAFITMAMFAALTAVVVVTGKDFTFLGAGLRLMFFAMMGLILVSFLTGFHLGVWFSFIGVAFASGYILYDTSAVMQHYRTDQYVSASLALFASVALLFWYVLNILMSRD